MNTNATYHTAKQTNGTRIIVVATAIAAAIMLLAGIVGEAASRGVTLQLGGGEQSAACQAAHDVTLPPEVQAALRAQCAE
jgi:hypothetical protein